MFIYIYINLYNHHLTNRHPAKSTEKDQDFDGVLGHTFNSYC